MLYEFFGKLNLVYLISLINGVCISFKDWLADETA